MIFNHLSKTVIVPDVLAGEKNWRADTKLSKTDGILPQVSTTFPFQSQADHECLSLGNKTIRGGSSKQANSG